MKKKPWLEQTFCEQYHNVQMDDQVYMILQIIKQGPSEVVEEYYKRILKLIKCLQLKAYYQLLTTLGEDYYLTFMLPLLI
jgi:hypothetical protein